MAQIQFDASTVEPQQSFDPVPAGTYTAHIVESDLRPLKSGNGNGLSLTFEIIEGPFERRKVWANLNVQHTNPEAQRIGQQQLSSLCHAVGVMRLADTTQLHGKPLRIRVAIRKDEQYGDKNDIKGFEAAGVPGIMPGTSAKASAPAKAAAPWGAKAAA